MQSDPTNPYAEEHKDPQSAGDARPTAIQIVKDEGLINTLVGKSILVTGASSGLGIETVRALHLTGADLYMQVRDMNKGEAVRADVLATSEGKGSLEIVHMNLDSLDSVRKGAKAFLEKCQKLNVLVNNAGVRNLPETHTVDGFEEQFAVNHLSHFLLFQLLLGALEAGSSPSFQSRVINISSGAHKNCPINLDNLNLQGIYTPRLAYAHSKTANVLMANEIERRYGSSGVHGLSVHPGCILTGMQRHDTEEAKKRRLEGDPILRKVLKSAEQGAATQVWAAVARVWEGKGGVYLEECRLSHESENPDLLHGGHRSFVFDEDAQKKLWDASLKMVAL